MTANDWPSSPAMAGVQGETVPRFNANLPGRRRRRPGSSPSPSFGLRSDDAEDQWLSVGRLSDPHPMPDIDE